MYADDTVIYTTKTRKAPDKLTEYLHCHIKIKNEVICEVENVK